MNVWVITDCEACAIDTVCEVFSTEEKMISYLEDRQINREQIDKKDTFPYVIDKKELK